MRLSIAIILIGLLAGVSAGLIGHGSNGGNGNGNGGSNENGGSNRNGGSNGNGGFNGSGGQEQEELDIFAGPPFPGTSWIGGPQGGKWIGGQGGKSLAGHRGSNGWRGSFNAENERNGGIWH